MLAFGDSVTRGALASTTAQGYAALVASARGHALTNYAEGGATMLGGPAEHQTSILAQMLAVAPPSAGEIVVMALGINDIIAYGTDATQLASFAEGLETGLLHLTSKRRIPDPATAWEREQVLRGRTLPSVPDGPRVFVGNTLSQSVYQGSASAAARTAYSDVIAAKVLALQARGRRAYYVDINAAYDPSTQGADPPSNIHPGNDGHADIAAAVLAEIEAHP